MNHFSKICIIILFFSSVSKAETKNIKKILGISFHVENGIKLYNCSRECDVYFVDEEPITNPTTGYTRTRFRYVFCFAGADKKECWKGHEKATSTMYIYNDQAPNWDWGDKINHIGVWHSKTK